MRHACAAAAPLDPAAPSPRWLGRDGAGPCVELERGSVISVAKLKSEKLCYFSRQKNKNPLPGNGQRKPSQRSASLASGSGWRLSSAALSILSRSKDYRLPPPQRPAPAPTCHESFDSVTLDAWHALTACVPTTRIAGSAIHTVTRTISGDCVSHLTQHGTARAQI